jgi:hypothetical protein
MPTPREEIGDRMLIAVDALVPFEDREPTPEEIEEFWGAFRRFVPARFGGMMAMNIDAHGNVNMTFLKNQNKK